MTESRIIELLHKLNNKGEEVPPQAKLMPEYIESFSKSIANVLYRTKKCTSYSVTSKRLDLIEAIGKWCKADPKHVHVNKDNYICFLKTLGSTEEAEKDMNETKSASEIQFKDFHSEITEYYNELDEKNKKNEDFIASIYELDRDKFQALNFHCTLYKATRTYESIQSFLQAMFPKNHKVYDLNMNDAKVNTDTLSLRENQIQYAYALLNISSEDTVEKLTINVLKVLSCYDSLESFEIDYVLYLFKKQGFADDYVLKYFRFVYEKSFLNLCFKILQKNDPVKINKILLDCTEDDLLKKILRICNENKTFRYCVSNMLYYIFILSNYDERLLYVINCI